MYASPKKFKKHITIKNIQSSGLKALTYSLDFVDIVAFCQSIEN